MKHLFLAFFALLYIPVHAGGMMGSNPFTASTTTTKRASSRESGPVRGYPREQQDTKVQPPTRTRRADPAVAPDPTKTTTVARNTMLQPQEHNVVLTTADGLKRNGILTIRPHAKGNVVLSHPAAYNKDFFIPFEQVMFQQYNTLRFDFRRHGENSDDQYCTLGKNEIYEVQAAVDMFKKNTATKDLPIYGFGISMGAVTLIEAESKHPMFDGLILQAPFETLKEQIYRQFSFFRYPMMRHLIMSPFSHIYAKTRYRLKLRSLKPIKSIASISTPIFLIHAQDDPTVHFSAFQRLKKAGKSILAAWTPETGKHTALFRTHTQQYVQKCLDFLKKISTFRRE